MLEERASLQSTIFFWGQVLVYCPLESVTGASPQNFVNFVVLCGYCFLDAFDVPDGIGGLISSGKMFAKDPDSGRQDNGIVLDALDLQ